MGADIYIQERMSQPDVLIARKEFDIAVKLRDSLPKDTPVYLHEQAQQNVEKAYDAMYPEDGYFRDSYNNGSLFWQLGLSWWHDVGDLIDRYNPVVNEETGTRLNDSLQEDDNDPFDWHTPTGWDLDPTGISELLELVKNAKWQNLPPTDSIEYKNWCHENNLSEDGGPHSWIDYYVEKRERFIKFCENAIQNGWHMSCSI